MADIQHEDLTTIHPFAFVGTSDPGAVGVGKGWIDTTATPHTLKVRNASNTGWEVIGTVIVNLNDLTDVVITSATSGDVLTWDGSHWINQAPSGGGGGSSSLVTLTDVNISGQTDGQVVSWDAASSKWIATTPSGGGGGSGMTQLFQSANMPLSTTLTAIPGLSFNMVASGAYLVNFELYAYVDATDGFEYLFDCADHQASGSILHTKVSGSNLTSEEFDEENPMDATGGSPHAVTHSGFARARVECRGFIFAPSSLAHSGLVQIKVGSPSSPGTNSNLFGAKLEYQRLY